MNKVDFGAVKNRTGKYVRANIENTTAAVAASADRLKMEPTSTIVDAPGSDSYPITGMTYLLIPKGNNGDPKTSALWSFIEWAMDLGQRYAAELLYAPLQKGIFRSK